MLVLTRETTEQPGISSGINWSNDLCRGLVHAVDFGSAYPVDVASGVVATFNNGTREDGTSGIGQHYSATQYATLQFKRAVFADKATYLLFFDTYAPLGGNSFLFGDVEAASVGYNAGLYSNGTVFLFFIKNSGGTGISASSTTVSNTAKTRFVLAGTYDGANVKIWVNGVNEGTSAQTGNIGTGAFALNVNRWNGSSAHGVRPYHGLIWNRALSAGEIAAVTRNPWIVRE